MISELIRQAPKCTHLAETPMSSMRPDDTKKVVLSIWSAVDNQI